MAANNDQRQCEHGGEPTLGAAAGLCPRCLLRAAQAGLLGMASSNGEGDALVPGYRLMDKIGEGGMGDVFLAEQTIPVRREVAVKRLKPGLHAAEWMRRFELEREALAQLEHPNIAKILDAGISRDGRPFYAMELVDGLPLTHFCDRAKLDAPARLRLLATVCAAVQHAHQKGVLHGDLKPSNILVATDEEGAPMPKLIDFGLVRAGGKDRGGAMSSGYFGTPGYASPEQMGGARPADVRSDVYSLGVILRELLAPTDSRSGDEAGWMVRRATAPVPEERYESAAAFAADVRNFLGCRPLTAGPDAWTYRLRKFFQRERWRLALACAAVVALGGGASVMAWQSWRTRQAEEDVRIAREAGALDVLRTQITERMGWGASARNTGRYDESEQHFLAARQMAAQLGPAGELRRREIERALAQLYLTTRQHRKAEAVLKALVGLPPLGSTGAEEWESLWDLTRLYIESRRFDDAETPARRALEMARRSFAPRHPVYLKSLHLVGRVHTEQRRYREAYYAFVESVAGFRAHFGPDAPETRQAGADLAEVEKVLRNMELLPGK